METKFLRNKLERFENGTAGVVEKNQVNTWLSSNSSISFTLSEKETEELYDQILFDIMCHTAYPLFYPKKEERSRLIKKWIVTSSIIILSVTSVLLYFLG